MVGALVVLAAGSGCSDEPAVRVGTADERFEDATVTYAEGDEFAMLTKDGAVKLGLTRDRVYFELSDALREHVDAEMSESMESDSRIGRSIAGAVRRGVQSALRIDIDFRVDEIRDVEYRAGELVFIFEDPDREEGLRNVEVNDEPIGRAFEEEDARAFVDAFRRVKRGEQVRGDRTGDATSGAAAEDSVDGGASGTF